MISVIIPMYNAENVILNALNSVKNQTFPREEFEIIVVNDGSTDKSREVVENYIQKNSDLQIQLLNQENGGVSKARNTGLKIAKGDFIALLDSDDEWYPQKTKNQMSVLKNPDFKIDFLSCRRKNHKILYPYKIDENNLVKVSFRQLMLRNEIQPSTVIFNCKILENCGYFNNDQRYAEDLNYWLRVSKHNKIAVLNEELIVAGSGKRTFGVSGLSANLKKMEKGFQKNLKEVLNQKRINFIQYVVYFLFYKLKYIVRISRNTFLNLQG